MDVKRVQEELNNKLNDDILDITFNNIRRLLFIPERTESEQEELKKELNYLASYKYESNIQVTWK